MVTLDENTSVLAAILSDISDHGDMNFSYVLSANKYQQQINNDRKNSLKQRKHQTKSQFVYKHMNHVTKLLWIIFLWSKKMRALSREQIRKRSFTKLAPRVGRAVETEDNVVASHNWYRDHRQGETIA